MGLTPVGFAMDAQRFSATSTLSFFRAHVTLLVSEYPPQIGVVPPVYAQFPVFQ